MLQQRPHRSVGGVAAAIVAVAAGLIAIVPSAMAACSICSDGADITKPQQELNLQVPFLIPDCASLDAAVGFISESSEDCAEIRTLGGLCGCPIPADQFEATCTICSSSSETLQDPNFQPANVPSFLSAAPAELDRTCGLVDSILRGFDRSSATCQAAVPSVSDCVCVEGGGANDDAPSSGDGDGGNNGNGGMCALCPDNEAPQFRDKIIDIPGIDIPVETCGELETVASTLIDADSENCTSIQFLSGYCGCMKQAGACSLCPGGQPVPLPNKELEWVTDSIVEAYQNDYDTIEIDGFLDEKLTCMLFDGFLQSSVDETSTVCFSNQLRRASCGCEPNPRLALLTWCQRVSGFLSFMGSSFIIINILWDPEKRSKTYHQLMLGVSSCDWVGSVASMFASLFLPKSHDLYQAIGNDFTCKLQGAMLQFSYASLWYNFALATHFYLVISRGWKENHLRPYRRWCHGIILTLGVGLAFGGIPFYGPILNVCYILNPPFAPSWVQVSFFFLIPTGLSIVGATVATLGTFSAVYKIEKASQRWRLQNQSNPMTRQVFWQSLWYLVAFYITFPILFISLFLDMTATTYPIFVAVAIFSPSQGLSNFLVYFRRSFENRQNFSISWFRDKLSALRDRSSFLVPRRSKNRNGQQPNAPNRVDEGRENPRSMTGATKGTDSPIGLKGEDSNRTTPDETGGRGNGVASLQYSEHYEELAGTNPSDDETNQTNIYFSSVGRSDSSEDFSNHFDGDI